MGLLEMLCAAGALLAAGQDSEDGPPPGPPAVEAYRTTVFPSGDEPPPGPPAPTYAAPALLHVGLHRLVLVCEERTAGASRIVARTSDDDGRTWSGRQLLQAGERRACESPTLLHDPASGALHLFTRWDATELRRSESRDRGASWSPPVRVELGVEDAVELGVGPGHGLALLAGPFAGRLLVPVWLRRGWARRLEARALFSDDGGTTWTLGAAVPGERACQGSMLELEGGVVALNLRVQGDRRRALVQSRNGGADWDPRVWNEELAGPTAQASWMRVDGPPASGRERVLYAGPGAPPDGDQEDSAPERGPPSRADRSMIVRLSGNGGASWPVFRAVSDEPAGNGDLARSPQDTYFLAFEAAGRIELWNFDIHWLTEAWALYGGPPSPDFERGK